MYHRSNEYRRLTRSKNNRVAKNFQQLAAQKAAKSDKTSELTVSVLYNIIV